jgi:hypothetical protein
LSGAVVIVIVVCGAGVQGIGRMRVVVMANYRNRAVGIIAVNARVLEILEEMMNPMRRRRSEKKDEERYDSQRDYDRGLKEIVFRMITAPLSEFQIAHLVVNKLPRRNLIYQFAVIEDFITFELKLIRLGRMIAHVHHREIQYNESNLSRMDGESERNRCQYVFDRRLVSIPLEHTLNVEHFKIEPFKGARIEFAFKDRSCCVVDELRQIDLV